MTNGIKTSEFYVSLAATLYNVLLGMGLIPHSSEVSAAVSAVAAALVAFGYTAARAFVKANSTATRS